MHKSKRMGISTFSSSNENHDSYLLSPLAPKPLSVIFFPTSATPQPHHPFSHAVIPPKWSPSSSIPSHWLSSSPSPSFPKQTSLSACHCSPLARTSRLQEKSSPNVCVWTWMWQGRQWSGWGKTPVHSVAPFSCFCHTGRGKAFTDVSHKARHL